MKRLFFLFFFTIRLVSMDMNISSFTDQENDATRLSNRFQKEPCLYCGQLIRRFRKSKHQCLLQQFAETGKMILFDNNIKRITTKK